MMSETSKIISSQPGISSKASVLEPSSFQHLFTSTTLRIKLLQIRVFAAYVPLTIALSNNPNSSTKSMRKESKSSRNPYLTNYSRHWNRRPATNLNQMPSTTSPYSPPKKGKEPIPPNDNPRPNKNSLQTSNQNTMWWTKNNILSLYFALFIPSSLCTCKDLAIRPTTTRWTASNLFFIS